MPLKQETYESRGVKGDLSRHDQLIEPPGRPHPRRKYQECQQTQGYKHPQNVMRKKTPPDRAMARVQASFQVRQIAKQGDMGADLAIEFLM